ncbi:hypothetical protein F4777DRAFT_216459 [Nemania sp. FL0916]|nr:hypothetical protein F4777DRAFT_216459 [Nemania sp. FL0916]
MDRLDLRLLQEILMYLDLTSLRNAALSCRTLFHALKGAEVLITSKAFLRQIDYDLLPEAILVHMSKSFPLEDSVRNEVVKKLKHRECAPVKWNLSDALPLAQFHEKLSVLAKQAACEAFEKQPRLQRESTQITYEELRRFERAFYRFELFCNLHSYSGQDDDFFSSFSKWENEQLACVHEHLTRVISRPYNYLVDHDITWGDLEVGYIRCDDGYGTLESEYILSRGIEKIYILQQASGYTEWHTLLSRGEDRNDEPSQLHHFLRDKLVWWASPDMLGDALSETSSEAEEKDISDNTPFYEDPDPGPALIWEWMYRDRYHDTFLAFIGKVRHREWAFPFWGHSRLQVAGLLGDPDIPGPRSSIDQEMAQYSNPDRLKLLEETQRERSEIDGYGWYDRGDLSQVKRLKVGEDPPRNEELPQNIYYRGPRTSSRR